MHKLYCYVDESGQDTIAQKEREPIFVVAIVVLEKQREELSVVCAHYEQASGKGKAKWGKAGHEERLRYLRLVFADERFRECLRYSISETVGKAFDDATIQAIARAVLWKKPLTPYVANVYIDGLAKAKRLDYRRGLRRWGVSMGEVKGVLKDENNSLTRLADAIAGFVRDARENRDREATDLFERARQNTNVIEV